MSIEEDLYTTLGSIVGNRVRAQFPQPPLKPYWPAIRYTISGTPNHDICGDGDDSTADRTVQLDVVAEDYDVSRTLRLSVMAAMRTFAPPALLTNDFPDYDEATRTHRAVMFYEIHGSSS